MRLARSILCAGLVLAPAAAVAQSDKTDKGRHEALLRLYAVSVAADRCGFAMTANEAEAVDRAARRLTKELKLKEDEADALYSDADLAFEKQRARACDPNGEFARTFKDTLRGLAKP